VKIPFSKKELMRDNVSLKNELDKCYASNTCLELNREMLQDRVDETNSKIEDTNLLIKAHSKLLLKNKRLRKRITEIMDQFNIVYNYEESKYETKDKK